MTIVRVGATKKYSDGWESAFGKKSRKKQSTSSKAKKPVKKKPARSPAKKKRPKGKKR